MPEMCTLDLNIGKIEDRHHALPPQFSFSLMAPASSPPPGLTYWNFRSSLNPNQIGCQSPSAAPQRHVPHPPTPLLWTHHRVNSVLNSNLFLGMFQELTNWSKISLFWFSPQLLNSHQCYGFRISHYMFSMAPNIHQSPNSSISILRSYTIFLRLFSWLLFQ
jgi:hypothetical protein